MSKTSLANWEHGNSLSSSANLVILQDVISFNSEDIPNQN